MQQRAFYRCAKIRERQLSGQKGQSVYGHRVVMSVLSNGIERTYALITCDFLNLLHLVCLRKKILAPTCLPKLISMHTDGNEYHFLIHGQGGGSANKTFLHQGTPSLLKEELLLEYLRRANCRPGDSCLSSLSFSRGHWGNFAEANLKTVKLASARYLDDLPTAGNPRGHAIRCPEMEKKILK